MVKKSNEKIRATLKKSFIDCMSCPKCGSDNYRRLKGDTIKDAWRSTPNFDKHHYIVRKYCDDCKELHEYKYKLITNKHYKVVS